MDRRIINISTEDPIQTRLQITEFSFVMEHVVFELATILRPKVEGGRGGKVVRVKGDLGSEGITRVLQILGGV